MLEQKKYLFISKIFSKVQIQCVHPDDKRLPIPEQQQRDYRIDFNNAVYQTNDDREAEALRAHPDFGRLFFEDGLGLKVESEYDEADQPLVDHWDKMNVMKLKGICSDKQLRPWGELKKMNKPQLIKLMLQKQSLIDPKDKPINDTDGN